MGVCPHSIVPLYSGGNAMKLLHRRQFLSVVGLGGAAAALGGAAAWLAEQGRRYGRERALRLQMLHLQAQAIAAETGQFIEGIKSQVGWTTQLPWSDQYIEQRRFDALRLLRQAPAITDFAQLDSSGKEQLRVSRLAMDVVGSQTDFSQDPKFTEAVVRKVYYGPVYFRRQSEPFMTL